MSSINTGNSKKDFNTRQANRGGQRPSTSASSATTSVDTINHHYQQHQHHRIFADLCGSDDTISSKSRLNDSYHLKNNTANMSKQPSCSSVCSSSSNKREIDSGDQIDGVYKKYSEYAIKVDEEQDDKAIEIRLCSLARPHMRAFHCAWWGFFVAFFIWFAISPLQSEIMLDLNLTKEDIWTSNIAGVAGTIVIRIILGPACDKWAARIPMAVVLCVCSIPTACTGFVNSALGLTFLRLFIGCAGGCFVMCQYWTSRMFAKEVAGTANALVGGWGNLGGGVTQLVVGAGLFPLFKWIFDDDASKAWRYVSIVPAILAFTSGVMIYKISDDCPKGQYSKLKKHGCMVERSAVSFFREGICNVNTWILFLQYACCFGTELTMNNAAAMYFYEKFVLSTEEAAAIASIFGWLNIFARGLGGYCSDKANAYFGMRGRLWFQTGCLVAEGALVLLFAQTQTLSSAITVMVFFSLFVQAAEGSTYGIVPYVDPPTTGAIAGIVGAGGNAGAVCFSIGFRQLDEKNAFTIMGFAALGSAMLSMFILIKGHAGMFCGKDEHDIQNRRARHDVTLFTPYNNNGGNGNSKTTTSNNNKVPHPIFGGMTPLDCNASSSSSSSDDDDDDYNCCDTERTASLEDSTRIESEQTAPSQQLLISITPILEEDESGGDSSGSDEEEENENNYKSCCREVEETEEDDDDCETGRRKNYDNEEEECCETTTTDENDVDKNNESDAGSHQTIVVGEIDVERTVQ